MIFFHSFIHDTLSALQGCFRSQKLYLASDPFATKAVPNTVVEKRVSLKLCCSSDGHDMHLSWTQAARHSSHRSVCALWSSCSVMAGISEAVFKSPTISRLKSSNTFSVCARAKLSSRKRETAWTNRR